MINTAYAEGHYASAVMREMTARHGYYYGGVNIGGVPRTAS